MTIVRRQLIKRGKTRRLKKNQLQHNPNGRGKGRWHSRATLWASKLKGRRLRQISANSRRINRT